MHKRSNGIWHTCIRHNGKKIQRSLKTSNKKLALAREAKIRTGIIEGSYFEKPIGNDKTFSQLVAKFIKEYAPKKSVNMQKSYTASSKHLIPFFGNLNLALITSKKISKYKVVRYEEGASPSTINSELAMLSRMFTIAVEEWEWLDHKPFLRIKKEQENNVQEKYLTYDEEKRLIENCPEWLKDLVVFSLNTGLRQHEQLSLTWERVSMQRRDILILETKSGRPRSIPLNKAALGVLERMAKTRSIKNDLVFFSNCGTKLNNCNLIRAFKKAVKKVEISNFTWHGLRRTFATRMAHKGLDIYKISRLLGHEDVQTTQKRYAHHCTESLRIGVDILDVDFNLTSVGEKEGFLSALKLS
ncbi:MAG: tyrosine-type recombinase/integrase [Candidatus Scalindua sp.]|nr:tyrosine-type recombinase/integrase [Candidatus Scalindua sp.]